MALVPVIQGAGGVVTDWRGQPLRWSVGSHVSGRGGGWEAAPGRAERKAAAQAVLTDLRASGLDLPAVSPPACLQGDVSACSGEVVAAGDARAHQQALDLLQWK